MAKIRVKVFDAERYDGDWPPENAAECMAWFAEKLEAIPAECLKTATIEFESESGYEGTHYPRISIYYDRKETADEIAARKKDVLNRKNAEKERELRTLAALKAKYES